MGKFARALAAILFALFAVPAPASAQALPKVGHVFIIVLENEGYADTFGPTSPAAFLNALVKHGALLENYYGIGHYSLDNYLAMISGQAPNPVTQADCPSFVDFVSTGTDSDGQALGQGCVFPSTVATIANQLDAKGLTWKGYMEDMGNLPERERVTCGRPNIGEQDKTHTATAADQYASRHDPFVYFHKIIDDGAYCDAHVVNFRALAADLLDEKTTPNYVFITPNLCHDGHDGGGKTPCADGTYPGGLISADKFLADTVPSILASPAFRHDGLLIITFDEADIDIELGDTADTLKVKGDASACCGEPRGPNIEPDSKLVFGPGDTLPDKGPGVAGPGGGKIGAVLVSRFIKPGTVSQEPYNHYSMLRSIEDIFGLDHLGYAGQKGLKSFGSDVFTQP